MPVEAPRIKQPAVLDDRHRHVLSIQRQPHFTFAARGLLPPFRERAQGIRRGEHRVDGETRVAKRGEEGAGQRIGRGRGLVQVPGDNVGVLGNRPERRARRRLSASGSARSQPGDSVAPSAMSRIASPPGRTRTTTQDLRRARCR